MGTMSILSASINGKIGNMYGVKDKGKAVLKATPFSHAPHNETQTKCVRAFEVLNRFSAGIATSFFQYMGLSDKNMLKHNAIARLFKPLIKNKVFNIKNGKEVVTVDDTVTVESFIVDNERNTISLTASTTEAVDKENGKAWFVGVFSNTGVCFLSKAPDNSNFSLTFSVPIMEDSYFYAVSFRADVENGKVKLHGWVATSRPLVIMRRVYIDNFENPQYYSAVGNRLVITDPNVRVIDGRVIVEA